MPAGDMPRRRWRASTTVQYSFTLQFIVLWPLMAVGMHCTDSHGISVTVSRLYAKCWVAYVFKMSSTYRIGINVVRVSIVYP